jgi:hypothetical protein
MIKIIHIPRIFICHLLILATILSPLSPYLPQANAETANTNTPAASKAWIPYRLSTNANVAAKLLFKPSAVNTNGIVSTNGTAGSNSVPVSDWLMPTNFMHLNPTNGVETVEVHIEEPQEEKEIEILGYDESSPLFSQRIEKFLKSVSKSHYQFRMTEIEIAKALNFAGFKGIMYQAGRRSARVRGEVHNTSESELAYIDNEFNSVKKEAQAIANDMLDKSSSTEDLNLKLFVLAHLYLTNPRARGAIQEIVEAFKNKINEKYFRDLEKSKRPSDQMAQAAYWTAIVAVVLSLKKPAQGSKTMLTLTRESSAAYMKQVSQRLFRLRQAAHSTDELAHVGSAAASHMDTAAKIVTPNVDNINTIDDLMRELRALGAQLPDSPAQMKEAAEIAAKESIGFRSALMRRFYSQDYLFGVSRQLTISQIMKWLRTRTTSENAYNLYFLTGVSVAAGGANVAGHKIKEAFHTVGLNDQRIDLRELIDKDYNELSTLMLQCKIHALKDELDLAVKAGENLWNAQRMDALNSWLADSELVRRFTTESGVAQKRLTSMPVRYDKDLNAYVAKVNYLNHEVQELIPCVQPENFDPNAPAQPIEIGFEDALLTLRDIVDMSNTEFETKRKEQAEKQAKALEEYRQRANQIIEANKKNLEKMQNGTNSFTGTVTNTPSAVPPLNAPISSATNAPVSATSTNAPAMPTNTPAVPPQVVPFMLRLVKPLVPPATNNVAPATNSPPKSPALSPLTSTNR